VSEGAGMSPRRGRTVCSDASQVAEPSYRVLSVFFFVHFCSSHHLVMSESPSSVREAHGELHFPNLTLSSGASCICRSSRKRIIRSPIDHLCFSFLFLFACFFHNLEKRTSSWWQLKRNGADLLHFMHAGVSG